MTVQRVFLGQSLTSKQIVNHRVNLSHNNNLATNEEATMATVVAQTRTRAKDSHKVNAKGKDSRGGMANTITTVAAVVEVGKADLTGMKAANEAEAVVVNSCRRLNSRSANS